MGEDKTQKKLWKSDTEKMLEYLDMLRANPDKMEEFFIEVGIWDKDGNLMPQYNRTE